MRRQEEGERDAGHAMDQERPVGRMVARGSCPAHHRHDASQAQDHQQQADHGHRELRRLAANPSHSAAIVRSPIAPWIAAAITNTE